MIVVDTNVMVYLLTGTGPWKEAVELLRTEPDWAAPPLLSSELRNVLLGLMRRDQLSESVAREICADAEAVVGDRAVSVPAPLVLEAAVACGLSAYDGEFVALARSLGTKLVTADQEILDGAPDVAVSI